MAERPSEMVSRLEREGRIPKVRIDLSGEAALWNDDLRAAYRLGVIAGLAIAAAEPAPELTDDD